MCVKNIGNLQYIWNPSTYPCKINNYLKTIICDSVVRCDENTGAVAKL